eukprot:TRINITY_DN2602_c0_g1_i14.p1 TRINITY_DN2602_c0_g1~~TRINITY_DN2602_c0_g1_i14.p1  ORF type:complete len:305 (+),score=112.03 TRINITY_DN2602_c0_g1_i14:605-1519(+)
MKPLGSSQGRGIYLVNDITSIAYGEPMIIQEYIANPLLIDGFKFDLRLYVLVTSFQPLEVFLYQEGFARLSTMPYSVKDNDIHNVYIHLTNSSIQKNSTSENILSTNPDEQGGSKISCEYMNKRLAEDGVDVDTMWNNITEVIIKSLFVVEDHITQNPSCFEVFGYDILVDQDLKAWLIEVNASPSMATETPLDKRIKTKLMYDTIKLIDPLPYDRALLREYIQERNKAISKAKKSLTGRVDEKELHQRFNNAMNNIMNGRPIRTPVQDGLDHLGSYKQICPSPFYDMLVKKVKPNRGEKRGKR